jgi:hypothetical protein
MRFWVFLMGLLFTQASTAQTFDHNHRGFAEFLGNFVSDSGVDYAALASIKPALEAYVLQLATVTTQDFNRDQQIAFWVNAYNALTVKLILDEKQPKSIMELDGGKVWDTRKYNIAGKLRTLNDIEHKMARPLTDGRVHAVLNCASKGCPPLLATPLVGENIESQLNKAATRWVKLNAFTRTENSVAVNQIFQWFADDFAKWQTPSIQGLEPKETAALRFIGAFGPAGLAEELATEGITVSYAKYDWSLNQK